MPASIYCQPVDLGRRNLDVSSPSSFMEAIEKAFGQFPIVLGKAALPILQGMVAVSKDKIYAELTDLVERHGSIRLWAVW